MKADSAGETGEKGASAADGSAPPDGIREVLEAEAREREAGKRFRASLRRLSFTRQGKIFVAVTLGVGLAALNTGNNLLFLILGLLLATIIVSGILAESSLRDVSVMRLPGQDAVAREPFLCTFRVTNLKRRRASFSLTVMDPEPPLERVRASALFVPPGESVDVSAETIAPQRGLFRLRTIRLATRFPFGFFEKSRDMEVPGEQFVLPGRRQLVLTAADEGGQNEGALRGLSGDGAELKELREMVPGDDRRRIHFRKSAAAGRFLIAEREDERAKRLTIVVDNTAAAGSQLEEDIENAAALIRHLDAAGTETGLAVSGTSVPPGSGPEHVSRELRLLSLTEASPDGPVPERGSGLTLDIAAFRSSARVPSAKTPAQT